MSQNSEQWGKQNPDMHNIKFFNSFFFFKRKEKKISSTKCMIVYQFIIKIRISFWCNNNMIIIYEIVSFCHSLAYLYYYLYLAEGPSKYMKAIDQSLVLGIAKCRTQYAQNTTNIYRQNEIFQHPYWNEN